MEDKLSIRGYHGTCSKYSKSIEENGLDPGKVKYRRDHWLGQGVYFYNDMHLAEWWANDQSTKKYNKGTYPLVYRAQLTADKKRVLNLDKTEQIDAFIDFILQSFKDIEKVYTDKKPEFDEHTFRAVYFDYYKRLHDISIIIYTFRKELAGYGKRRTKEEAFIVKKFTKALGVAYHETQICVSDKTCIKNVEIVYNGEEEVI